MFIVIVSIGLVGLLSVYDISASRSADPLVAKQAAAIAESLLTEVEQMPFSWCDPQDVNAESAVSAAGCSTGSDQNKGGGALGPVPAGETRGNAANPFDNVADYAGFGETRILDGRTYNAAVAITRAGGAVPFAALPLDAVLRIAVTVVGPNNTSVTVVGYRVRYAPNALG